MQYQQHGLPWHSSHSYRATAKHIRRSLKLIHHRNKRRISKISLTINLLQTLYDPDGLGDNVDEGQEFGGVHLLLHHSHQQPTQLKAQLFLIHLKDRTKLCYLWLALLVYIYIYIHIVCFKISSYVRLSYLFVSVRTYLTKAIGSQ